MNFIEATEVVEGLRVQLGRIGVRVVQENNPTHASQLLRHLERQTAGAAEVNKWLDPDIILRTQGDYFLLTFWCHGRIVAKMAARIDDTHGEAFDAFVLRGLKTVFREDNGTPSDDRMPSETAKMSGKIAYVGDLFVVDDFRGGSGAAVTPIMLSLLFLTIQQRWGVPDYTVACIRPQQSIGQDWRSLWDWIPGMGGFTKPAESDFRGYWLGVIKPELYQDHLAKARRLAGYEQKAVLGNHDLHTPQQDHPSSYTRDKVRS